MLQKVAVTILLISFLALEFVGQIHSKEYWKEIADDSKAIVVGIVEEDYRVIRPEKFKPNPDGSHPGDREIYVGMVFRVKMTEKIKGNVKTKKIGANKYVNVFVPGAYPGLGTSDPKIFKGKEYVLFLEPNNDKELEGKATVEFRLNTEIIITPFDYRKSYLVVHGFRGTVGIKGDREKLIKEIKQAIH